MRRIALLAVLGVGLLAALAALRKTPESFPPPERVLGPLPFWDDIEARIPAAAPPTRLDSRALYERGRELLGQGDNWEALRDLSTAFERLPDDLGVCEQLARVYFELNLMRDLLPLVACLETGASEGRTEARRLLHELSRSADVEGGFHVAASDHFILSHSGKGRSAAVAGRVLDMLERGRRSVHRRTGFSTDPLVPVVLYDDPGFTEVTGGGMAGVYDGKIRVTVGLFEHGDAYVEKVLTHEYVHALFGKRIRTSLPRWFHEGLADSLATVGSPPERWRPPFEAGGEVVPYEALSSAFSQGPGRQRQLAYRQAFWMAQQLIDEAGWQRMEDLLGLLRDMPAAGFEFAFTLYYRETPPEFFERWVADLDARG